MDDRERVAAIRAGDPRGLASTYDTYADALFGFCHGMLRDRAAAEDAVHDTFVVLGERVGQLRDPSRLRPWLYAVARTVCLRQLRAAKRVTPTEELADVSDDTVDIGGDLQQAQLRELVWQAVEGLNPGERAALELSLRHGLDGDDLAAALDLTRGTLKKTLQRARADLERGLGALLVSRAGRGDCPELNAMVEHWDGRLTVLMRKRLSRHIDSCAICGQRKRRVVSASALLGAIPLAVAPAALRDRVVGSRMRQVSFDRDRTGDNGSRRRAVARRVGQFDRAGFPATRAPHRRFWAAAAAVVVLAAMGLLLAVVHPRSEDVGVRRFAPAPAVTTPGASPTPAASTATPSSPPVSSPQPTSTSPSSRAPRTTRTTRSPVSPVSPAPPVSPVSQPPPVPPQAGVLGLSTTKVDLGTLSSSTLVLTATGGTVTWAAKTPPGVSVSPPGGTIAAGGKTEVTLVLDRTGKPTGPAVIDFVDGGTDTAVTVSWS